MAELRATEVARFFARPDPSARCILIFGNDAGLVSERASTLAATVLGDDADALSHIHLDSAEIAADPKRLADEAYAIPMFGGTRCISVRVQGAGSIVPALEPLIATPPEDAFVVIAAGELRKTAPLRKLFAAAANAVAIACYADDAQALSRVIDEETNAAGLAVAGDAREALTALLGGDRMASRGEVVKLCLYAAGKGEITIEDVRAIVGDASAFAVDEAVDAAASGDAEGFARAYRRLVAAGTADFAVIGAAVRHFDMLHRARAAVDAGTPPDRALPPQIFFRRRPVVSRQVTIWSLPRIERALDILNRAVVDSRLRGAISVEVVGQAMLAISAIAGSRRRAA
ncbi:DNA polymerase III subunit delta [Bauldia sp.]|uniref:DNA polymerase III subunit delta n=1 Tax=Bauldia sp. TaxID=2575872 RepID=UPI003BAA4040